MFFSFEKSKNELKLVKPIKKSNYLKNLEKKRYEGLRRIEEGKADILVDKILKTGQIYRDYSIFNHKNKVKDNNINEKNFTVENKKGDNTKNLKKYKNCNLSNNYHRKNIISNKNKKDTKDMFITGNNGYKNILTLIGDDIIKSNYLFTENRKNGNKHK